MSVKDALREQLINWNVRFPLDREYRKKYKIAFASAAHREINQIDILMEHLEDEMYEEFKKEAMKQIEAEKQFKEGKWLKDTVVDSADELDLFNKLKVSDISNLEIEE